MAETSSLLDSPSPGSDAAKEEWLVVDQVATVPVNFTELLNAMHRNFALDPYSARQRLLGRGYNLLLRGRGDKLSPLLTLLAAHAIPARLLTPPLTRTHPVKLQSLRQRGASLLLLTANGELSIDGDMQVVAVFADLSGAVVANGVKQLLVRRAYQGTEAAAPQHDDAALCRAISKARPVLDLYLLDPQGGVRGAVRALPGSYDPSGLGAEQTLSAGLNLLALLEVARRSAGRLTLRSDFGLANLPGCQLDTPLSDANQGKNLAALSRFGQLAAQFVGQESLAKAKSAELPLLPGLPLLPTPLHHAASANALFGGTETATPGRALPPPPEGGEEAHHHWLWPWPDTLGALFFCGGLLLAGMGPGRLWPWFWQQGVASGVLPALLASFLLWRAFAAVRLKRMIENTPVSRIRSLATGMVEVCGRAERCFALVTPVTQTPCIYYRLRRYGRDHPNGKWRLTAQRTSGLHPFWLRDATGKVLVDPISADLRPGHRQEGSGDGLNNAFLSREFRPDSGEKWVEESIPEGEMLYVLGFATPHRNGSVSLREVTAAQLRLLKQSHELRERFDQNGDGQIDAVEWDEARRVTADEVARTHLSGQQQRRKQEEFLVIGAPPRRSLPFLIAQSLNEKIVTRALWWRALGFFLAGLLLAGWALRQLFYFLPVTGY